MERNILQQLQDIEQQLLAKKAIQVHIHISLSPGSPGLSESDIQQLMNDVDSVCEKEPTAKPSPNRGRIEVVNDMIRITLFSATGETNASLKGVTAENMAEAARILSAWLDAPPQKRIWKEWSKPNRPGLWAFTYPAANGTVFYQEVSEVGAKIPTRWSEGHWCYICPAPKIEYRQKQEELETIPTERWPKYYVPVKPVKSSYGKEIAYYRRDDRFKGETFHVDGTSFTFLEWDMVNAKEVTELEAKKRSQNKHESITLEFSHERPNKVGIWAYKTSTRFSDGRLAFTVVNDVNEVQCAPSPGRWAYVGDHR